MSRNGSGTYNLPAGNPVTTGTTISSTWANNTLSDMATALTQSIAYDGQTTPIANLPMGTYAHTNVGNATARTMYASAGQVEDGTLNYLTSVSGTNAITATAPVSLSAYVAGQTFRFIAAGANTGAVTLNLNAIGAKAVTRDGTTALVTGDILAGGVYQVTYDGTQFQLTNSSNASVQVTSFSAGTTGLTPNTATTGAVTLGGTLNVANGGTGLTSFTSGQIHYGAFNTNANFVFDGTNLGIGTSSPAKLLHLYSTGNNAYTRYQYSGSGSYFEVGQGADSIAYVWNATNTGMLFGTNNTERMRIDSSGNVGIGTSSPSSYGRLVSKQSADTSVASLGLVAQASTTDTFIGIGYYSSTDVCRITSSYISTGAFKPLSFWTSDAERMRIDSSGNLLVNTTSMLNSGQKLSILFSTGNNTGSTWKHPDATGAAAPGYLNFFNSSGTQVGYIACNGSSTTYSTSSDYRLKDDVQPMVGALEKVVQLNPVTYTWKNSGLHGQGFIAHELQEIVPDCVTGEKDATREEEYEVTPAIPAVLDEEGNIVEEAVPAVMGTRTVPVYQGIDTSFLVATLTAAIQELAAKVTALEAQLTK